MTNKDLEDRIKRNLFKYYKCEGRNKSWYYIPELGEWVNKFNNELKALGYTQRYWYNKMILGIDDPEFKPTCQLDGCNNQVGNFKGVKYGYPSYCCNSHKMKTDESISRFKAATNTRSALDKKNQTPLR